MRAFRKSWCTRADAYLLFNYHLPVFLHYILPVFLITYICASLYPKATQRAEYLRLLQMATDILSIPAILAKVERVFSSARWTILWERLRARPRVVERFECLESWLRQVVKLGGSGLQIIQRGFNIELNWMPRLNQFNQLRARGLGNAFNLRSWLNWVDWKILKLLILYKNVYSKRSHAFPLNSNINIYHN